MMKDNKPDNIFDSIPDNLDEEVFDLLFQNDQVKIERIISKGHSSPALGWYDQSQNEWMIVLKGEAVIAFEGDKDIYLTSGSYLHIPAHAKHQVKWTQPDVETVWLAVFY